MPRLDCDGCKGTGKVYAHIQYTDRSKPCEWDWRPCPLCYPDEWDEAPKQPVSEEASHD